MSDKTEKTESNKEREPETEPKLTDADLDDVAGGYPPMPLPPGRGQ